MTRDQHGNTMSMCEKRRVTRAAMAPGAISMAITRMMPTAFSAATMVTREQHQQPVMQQPHRQADRRAGWFGSKQ
jgi:hypothetical protein